LILTPKAVQANYEQKVNESAILGVVQENIGAQMVVVRASIHHLVRRVHALVLAAAVDLVEHEQARHLGGADLVEHALHRRDLALALLLVGRGVGDVQHEVGEQRLLERRGERGDELVR